MTVIPIIRRQALSRMRSRLPWAVTLAALLLPWRNLAASQSYRLETNVYVFKDGDFQSITLPETKEEDDRRGLVIRSPATIRFDREKLALAGPDFSWNGGPNPPEQFTQIKTPWIITPAGQAAEMMSTTPVQYIERNADGTFRVRDIGKDSPAAPHCRFKFTVRSPDENETGGGLRVSCELDIATIAAREKVPGLSLDVGKPKLARFRDQVELAVRPGEWAALLLRTPNGSDYSLLLLLKTTAAKSGRLMTAKEFARFATYYYRHPQPELTAKAIESLPAARGQRSSACDGPRFRP